MMTVSKEILVDLNEKFNKIIKLIFEDSKLDPEHEPYKSKYSAQDILLGMKATIEAQLSHFRGTAEENLKLKGIGYLPGTLQFVLLIVFQGC